MDEEIEILSQFKKNLVSFFDELIAQFPAEGDLVVLRIFLKDQFPIKSTMDMFVYTLNKNDQIVRKMIEERNDSYFLDTYQYSMLFGKEKIAHFKKIWRSDQLDDDDRTTIWSWIDTFVFYADKYNNNKNKKSS